MKFWKYCSWKNLLEAESLSRFRLVPPSTSPHKLIAASFNDQELQQLSSYLGSRLTATQKRKFGDEIERLLLGKDTNVARQALHAIQDQGVPTEFFTWLKDRAKQHGWITQKQKSILPKNLELAPYDEPVIAPKPQQSSLSDRLSWIINHSEPNLHVPLFQRIGVMLLQSGYKPSSFNHPQIDDVIFSRIRAPKVIEKAVQSVLFDIADGSAPTDKALEVLKKEKIADLSSEELTNLAKVYIRANSLSTQTTQLPPLNQKVIDMIRG